ncbi:MAG: hypothetical protein CM15mP32_4250 [Flavobacteriaceae bacterium]|nr:MAG: hypothetical protein CM15mP32_4250 [Flavobacteriaceae bacterium]
MTKNYQAHTNLTDYVNKCFSIPLKVTEFAVKIIDLRFETL